MMRRRGQQEAVALRALEEYSESLMGYPNVVGVGLVEDEEEGEGSGLYMVKIYVSEKPDPIRLLLEQPIPRSLAVRLPDDPDNIVWIPTVVEDIGEVELEAG